MEVSIDHLTMTSFNWSQIEKVDSICSICLDVANDHTETQCNHLFCKSCLDTWLAKQFTSTIQATCPMCRKEIVFFLEPNNKTKIQKWEEFNVRNFESDKEWYLISQIVFMHQLGLTRKIPDILRRYRIKYSRLERGFWFHPFNKKFKP